MAKCAGSGVVLVGTDAAAAAADMVFSIDDLITTVRGDKTDVPSLEW